MAKSRRQRQAQKSAKPRRRRRLAIGAMLVAAAMAGVAIVYVARSARRRPEAVVRRFLLARLDGDATEIRRLTIPHPEVHLLCRPLAYSPAERRELQEKFRSMPLARAKPGDSVPLGWHGAELHVSDEQVNDHSLLFSVDWGKARVPVRVERRGGRWLVDPTYLIEMHKMLGKR